MKQNRFPRPSMSGGLALNLNSAPRAKSVAENGLDALCLRDKVMPSSSVNSSITRLTFSATFTCMAVKTKSSWYGATVTVEVQPVLTRRPVGATKRTDGVHDEVRARLAVLVRNDEGVTPSNSATTKKCSVYWIRICQPQKLQGRLSVRSLDAYYVPRSVRYVRRAPVRPALLGDIRSGCQHTPSGRHQGIAKGVLEAAKIARKKRRSQNSSYLDVGYLPKNSADGVIQSHVTLPLPLVCAKLCRASLTLPRGACFLRSAYSAYFCACVRCCAPCVCAPCVCVVELGLLGVRLGALCVVRYE